MSSCMRYQQQISQMLDGELPAEQVQTLRAHLRTCPDCRHVYDDFLSLQTAVRDAAAEPPADLAARIMQQVRREPVPMAPRTATPTRPVRHTQPASIRKAPAKPAARKRPVSGRTSPLLPISVMAACLALILGATLWFTPRRNPSSSAGTALDSSRIPTATASPSINDEAKGNQKQDGLPAAESESVLDDSVSSLLFSVPAEDSADSTVLHISDRITILRLGKVVGTVDRAETDGQKLAGMMIGKELTESHYEKVDASGHEIVAELDHVDYNKESKHSGLADLSLRIHAGEIVGVAGVDGNGQTQLAQLITGVIAPQSGTVQLKGDRVAVFDPNGFIEHGVSHVPEDRNLQGLIGDMSIAENLVLKDTDDPRFSHGHGLRLNKRAIHAYAQSMMEKYDVRATSDSQSVRELSGGNQQKVIIARELESGPSVLVMAHPTRGLDIGATSFVHDQMIAARARGVGILLISADFDEILEMSDRIVVCFEGRIMGEFSGSKPPINEISLAMTGK